MVQTILIIDDEKSIRHFLKSSLNRQGYQVIEAESVEVGLSLADSHRPELILLDLGLPDRDGREFLQEYRQWSDTPIIVLSARETEKEKILVLEAGADDYLVKPFGIGELLARIKAVTRRIKNPSLSPEQKGSLIFPGLSLDIQDHQVWVDEKLIHLTPIEFKLLALLAQNPGKILTHKFLLSEVWGRHSQDQDHYIRIYMANLRKKIEKDPTNPQFIQTETGVGYRFICS